MHMDRAKSPKSLTAIHPAGDKETGVNHSTPSAGRAHAGYYICVVCLLVVGL